LGRLFILLALAVIVKFEAGGSAEAAIAGRPDPADVRVVEDCLAHASSGGTPSESCVGVLAKPCEASAATPQAKAKCVEREDAVWSVAGVHDLTRLNVVITSDSAREALREAQTGYERAKSGLCTFMRVSRGNSPDGLLAASECRLAASARQDLWLESQIEALSKK